MGIAPAWTGRMPASRTASSTACAEDGRTRPEVARDIKFVAGRDSAVRRRLGLQVRQLAKHIDVDFELRQIDDLAAPAAGAELQRAGFMGESGAKSHTLLCLDGRRRSSGVTSGTAAR